MISTSGKRVYDFAIPMLEALDTARALSYAIALRYGVDSLFSVLEQPMHFGPFSLERTRREYESYMLLRKMPNIFGTDLEQVALDAFFKAEERCKAINKAGYETNRLTRTGRLEHRMMRVLASLLGPVPSLSTLSKLASWGPGATFDLSKADASPELKTIRERGITLPLLRRLQGEDCVGFLPPDSYSLTPGGRVTTVPKSVKTDRTIMVEPGINAFFQSGMGAFIRQLLMKRVGIDIRNAADRHRDRCLSEWSDVATIDLSAASDTISSWLLSLFPLDWQDLLCDLRSPYARVNDTWHELEKISSMGNGFTFELETLLFSAVCLASDVAPHEISVFGDDIIVPRPQASLVIHNLESLGFSINREKTFTSGDFVESCGAHCWRGVDLAPFQIKEIPSNGLQAIDLANKVRAFSWLSTGGNGCDRRYLYCWRLCHQWISGSLRLARGPYGVSGVLWCNYSEIPGLSYRNEWLVDGSVGLWCGSYHTKRRRSQHFRLLHHRLRFMSDAFLTYIPVYGSRLVEPMISSWASPSETTAYGNVVKNSRKEKVNVKRYALSQGWVQPGDWIVPAP